MSRVDEEQLTTIWEARGITPDTLIVDGDGTIADDPPRTTSHLALPRIAVGEPNPQLSLGDTLGQGGMGIVRSAVQVPLARDVAVKAMHPNAGDKAALGLVREARITGGLEHPNVVPVHAIGLDENGQPMIIMKRIEGRAWSDLIDDPGLYPSQQADHTALDHHLDVLLDVCNAVSFAHSRGIVHRDLKPDNVMIGAFGEVYVLDWALAVSVNDAHGDLMPAARDICRVAGTPAYMAPEMASAEGAVIGPRSDIYLLGATLHHLLTGKPRHSGKDVRQALITAYASEPAEYGDDVPAGLGEVANKAAHRDPEQRYESAEAFKQAILRYRRQQSSRELASDASARLELLRKAVRHPAQHELNEVRAAFSECRFAYQKALSTWPDNARSSHELSQALQLMVWIELNAGNPGAAATVMAELEDPPPELADKLNAEIARVADLERLGYDMDLQVGRRTRAFAMLVIGVLFSVAPMLMGYAVRNGYADFDLTAFALISTLFVGVIEGLRRWAKDTLSTTRVNRQLVHTAQVLAGVGLLLPAAGLLRGWSGAETILLLLLAIAIIQAMVAVTIDRKLTAAVGITLICFFVGAARIDLIFELLAINNLGCALVIAWVWRPDTLLPPPALK